MQLLDCRRGPAMLASETDAMPPCDGCNTTIGEQALDSQHQSLINLDGIRVRL
jgi:hypothetical protein